VRHKYPALAGSRIFLAEDDLLIVMMLEEMLGELGCEIVATASTVDRAVQVIRTCATRGRIDGVLLDLDLQGCVSSPVGDELLRYSLPYIVVSGGDPGAFESSSVKVAPRLRKPFALDALARQMEETFGRAVTAPPLSAA
jgi:CheY-like chemotaxis protein